MLSSQKSVRLIVLMTLVKAREREGVDGGEEPYTKHQRMRGNSCSKYRGYLHESRLETEGKV